MTVKKKKVQRILILYTVTKKISPQTTLGINKSRIRKILDLKMSNHERSPASGEGGMYSALGKMGRHRPANETQKLYSTPDQRQSVKSKVVAGQLRKFQYRLYIR